MLVKLFNGTPNIANMPEEEAREKGYKLAVFAEKPITESGFHATSYWTEENETCTQHWEIVQDEPYVPSTDDMAEAYYILMGVRE